ncbi:MAG TPA: hypothetical protein VMR54_17830 [Thermoanaerobaculia bacterium]|nr:hypothetical protein [Thermoanaerobaculia bacterium]
MPAEGHFLRLLGRSDLPDADFQDILRDRGARRYHAVRLALAGHHRTPRSEALALVATLFWRDLAHLSADTRVHPEVRRAADRDLLRRIPEMALAERVDLARTVGRGTLVVLRFDTDARVVAALLDNRFATEPDVVQAAARAATQAVLEVIAGHPRWSLRSAVRSALLRNPALPLSLALALLSRATREDLEGLRGMPGAPALLRACAERVLADRLARD